MDEEPWVEKVRTAMKAELSDKPGQSLAHRADHMERVCERALEMARVLQERENVSLDLEALSIAALLHDIHQPVDGKKEHAAKSAGRAGELLESLGYPPEGIPKVASLITEHSSEGTTHPSSLEGKILFDADKLDGLGAMGIARVFCFCGQLGLTPQEAALWYERKIAKALPMLQTGLAREMGQEDFEYVKGFLERFRKEF